MAYFERLWRIFLSPNQSTIFGGPVPCVSVGQVPHPDLSISNFSAQYIHLSHDFMRDHQYIHIFQSSFLQFSNPETSVVHQHMYAETHVQQKAKVYTKKSLPHVSSREPIHPSPILLPSCFPSPPSPLPPSISTSKNSQPSHYTPQRSPQPYTPYSLHSPSSPSQCWRPE